MESIKINFDFIKTGSINYYYYLYIYTFLPVFVAGEKKLKTGEKMVPSRLVRGGLLAASTGASSFPFGFIGLLLQVIASKKRQNA